MSIYAVVLICRLGSPCGEETSLREIIAPSPSIDELSCFATADTMRAKAIVKPGEVAIAYCREIPTTPDARYGSGRMMGPSSPVSKAPGHGEPTAHGKKGRGN